MAWYDNITDMRGYQNINKTGTQAWPEYNPNMFQGMGHGRFDMQNMRLPPNLSQDMGASNAPLPVYPGQRNIHEGFGTADVSSTFTPPERTGILQSLKNKFSGITTPMMALLRSQKNNPEEVFGLENFPTYNGRVNYSPQNSLYGNMNIATGFGAGLSGAGDKRLARIQETIANLQEEDGGNWSNLKKNRPEEFAKKLRFHQEKLKRMTAESEAYKRDLALQTGQGGTEIIAPPTDKKGGTTYGGPATKDFDPGLAQAMGGYKGAGTSGSYAAGPQSGSGYGPWSKKDGGRIGYREGLGPVLDENVDESTLEFMQDQGVPYGEMAEGKSPFHLRIDELMETYNMSYEDAYDVASDEFNQLAEGSEDSFSEEGIASLV